jgi:CheY-like chemotaxis protein
VIAITNINSNLNFKEFTFIKSALLKPVKKRQLLHQLKTAISNEQKTVQTSKEDQTFDSSLASNYPLSILVADDNLMNQKLAKAVLSKLGYQPDFAHNGKEVLSMVTEKLYDVILMDVQMPEMDGIEATCYIRLHMKDQPRIIAMTANVMSEDKEDCINAGMDDFLSKPIDVKSLVAMLKGTSTLKNSNSK